MEFAMLIYPSMQAADIFEMQNHIAHAGTDQRNVHVIAREVAEKLKIRPLKNPIDGSSMKPISIHHGLVSGLNKPAQWPLPENIDKKAMMTSLKMSKSVKGSAILLNDSEDEIREKINKAFCPEKEIGYNPVLNWIKMMIFPILGKFELKREEKFGGDKTYESFEELEADYEKGEIFPLDLKNNVAEVLVELMKPAREVFKDEKSQQIIKVIKDIKKTR
jgi:tyrosyl-tRNA synthetase